MSFSYHISIDNNLIIISLSGNLMGKPQVTQLMSELNEELNQEMKNT